MPSDLVWVALITSAAVLASAWLTAKFTDKSAQRQIDAQVATTRAEIAAQAEITRKQIELQRSEARRDRIVVARTNTLINIQNSLGSLFGAHSTFTSSVIGLQELDKSGVSADDPGRTRIAREIEAQAQIIQTETSNVTFLRSRISDPALVAILTELTNEIGAIVHGAAVDATDQNLTEKVVKMFVGLEVLRAKLPKFNQRIEELLSGDDLMIQ